jgi:flagellar biosynthesis protein FliQ
MLGSCLAELILHLFVALLHLLTFVEELLLHFLPHLLTFVEALLPLMRLRLCVTAALSHLQPAAGFSCG